jgi:hypothetical protein
MTTPLLATTLVRADRVRSFLCAAPARPVGKSLSTTINVSCNSNATQTGIGLSKRSCALHVRSPNYASKAGTKPDGLC